MSVSQPVMRGYIIHDGTYLYLLQEVTLHIMIVSLPVIKGHQHVMDVSLQAATLHITASQPAVGIAIHVTLRYMFSEIHRTQLSMLVSQRVRLID